MFKTENFKVKFIHNNFHDIENSKLNKKIKKQKSSTICEIRENTEEGKLIESGVSIVHPDDMFNKRLGRYYSFSKAVQKIDGTQERKELWEGFKSNPNYKQPFKGVHKLK